MQTISIKETIENALSKCIPINGKVEVYVSEKPSDEQLKEIFDSEKGWSIKKVEPNIGGTAKLLVEIN